MYIHTFIYPSNITDNLRTKFAQKTKFAKNLAQ